MSVLSFLALVMAGAALGVSLSSAAAAAKRHRRPQPVEPDKYTRFVIFNGGQRIQIGEGDVVRLTPDLNVINTSGVLRIKQTPTRFGGSGTDETLPPSYRQISDLIDNAKRKAEASRQAAETACGVVKPERSDGATLKRDNLVELRSDALTLRVGPTLESIDLVLKFPHDAQCLRKRENGLFVLCPESGHSLREHGDCTAVLAVSSRKSAERFSDPSHRFAHVCGVSHCRHCSSPSVGTPGKGSETGAASSPATVEPTEGEPARPA